MTDVNAVDAMPDAVAGLVTDAPIVGAWPQPELSSRDSDGSGGVSGLASLVRENAALGEALQMLVADFDRPVAKIKPALGDAAEVPGQAKPRQAAETRPLQVAEPQPLQVAETQSIQVPELMPRVISEGADVVRDSGRVEKPLNPVFEHEQEVLEPIIALTVPVNTPERMSVKPRGGRDSGGIVSAEAVSERGGTIPVGEIPVAVDRAFGVEPIVGGGGAPSLSVKADAVPVPTEAVERVVRVSELMGLMPSAPVDSVVPVEQLVSAANEVASFILVTPSLMRGESGEIRVQLRPDVLAGSEVVLAAEGRKLAVTFVPRTTAVADAVIRHAPEIVETLTTRVAGFQFSVDVAQTVATNVAVTARVAEASYRAPVRKNHERT